MLNRDACSGPRLPLRIISPYAKLNFVDHSITDQTSILGLPVRSIATSASMRTQDLPSPQDAQCTLRN
jgi:hypothetical protein